VKRREVAVAALLAVAAVLITAGAWMVAIPVGLVVAGFGLMAWTVLVFSEVGS